MLFWSCFFFFVQFLPPKQSSQVYKYSYSLPTTVEPDANPWSAFAENMVDPSTAPWRKFVRSFRMLGGEASRDQKWAKFLGWLSSRSLGAENWKWKVNAAWDLEGFVLKEMAIWRQCRWWVWNLHISRLQGISKSSSTANQLQYSDCILMLVMLPYPETNVLPDRCDDIMSCQDTYWMGHDLSFCQW